MSTRFHWIMTVADRGTYSQHFGSIDVHPGDTRTSVYTKLYDYVASKTSDSAPPVLFFSLEPDELGGPA